MRGLNHFSYWGLKLFLLLRELILFFRGCCKSWMKTFQLQLWWVYHMIITWCHMIKLATPLHTQMTYLLLPQMLERERGAVINVCSQISCFPPTPLLSAYTASMVCGWLPCIPCLIPCIPCLIPVRYLVYPVWYLFDTLYTLFDMDNFIIW